MQPPRLSFFDFIKAAFNLRVPIPGLGGVPLNWLYTFCFVVLGLKFWPVLVIGAAIECWYLLFMASSSRFQKVVRSRRGRNSVAEGRRQLDEHMASVLRNSDRYYDYQDFTKRCDSILGEVRNVFGRDEVSIETYSGNLLDFCQSYGLLLRMLESLERQVAVNDDAQTRREIARLEKEIADAGLSERIKASKQATLKTMQELLVAHEQQVERVELTRCEIERLRQQVELLASQVSLTKDPAGLSQRMDTAAAVLEEHTAWLSVNGDLLQSSEDDQHPSQMITN